MADVVFPGLPAELAARYVVHDPTQVRVWRAMLTRTERQQWRQIAVPRQKRAFLLGRVALRGLLGDVLAVPPRQVRLRRTTGQGLRVLASPHRLALATTGHQALAVVGLRPMGVALEPILTPGPDWFRLLFHRDEYGLFDTLPLDPARLFALWTALKTATRQAIEAPEDYPLRQFRLWPQLSRQVARIQTLRNGSLHLCFAERNGHYLALAFDGDYAEVTARKSR